VKYHLLILLPLLVLFAAMMISACGDDDDDDDDNGGGEEDDDDDAVDDDDDDSADDDDCQDIYDNSLAPDCIGFSSFEYYGCTEDDITDPECFIACIGNLVDGEDLCYDVEQCIDNCSDDDASGCANEYNGMPNAECIEYKDFFKAACDPRVDASRRNCVSACYENEADCDGFDACVEGCPE
jgi:hypothetical protein